MNKKKHILLTLICFLGISIAVTGTSPVRTASVESNRETQQTSKVSGTVKDDKGEPLPGVSIIVEGTPRGVITDLDGTFSIDVKSTDKLKFSFLGFENQTVTVGSQKNISVSMKEKGNVLDEVTVVAYGKQKKESVIGAISTVEIKNLEAPVGKISNNLAGQIPGIISVQRSGEPGASAEFWIRGVATFGSSKRTPLVLVDGIERSLDLVDVEDIASLSILKDATASAMYGVRGANGVMIVTTKRGKEGKPQVNVKAEFGVLAPVIVPKMADAQQWMTAYNDVYSEVNNGRNFYSEETMQKYLNGSNPDLYPNINWMDEMYKDYTDNQRISINVTGGGKNVRYYVAGSFYNENGIYNAVSGDDYNPSLKWSKYSFRSNIDIDLNKNLSLNLNLSNQYDIKNRPYANGLSMWIESYLTIPIATPKVYSDGTLAQPKNGNNPYYLLNTTGYVQDFNNNAQSLVGLTQNLSDLTPGLEAGIKVSWDVVNSANIYRRKGPSTYYLVQDNPYLPDGSPNYERINDGYNYMVGGTANSGTRTMYMEASVNYDRLFAKKHRVGGLFLYNMREKVNNNPGNYVTSLPFRYLGVAGRLTYSYLDKYFIEGNFGYNGSENFAPGHRFGFFPSVALGYIISGESYFDPLRDVISFLKIRGSYGEAGNDEIGGGRRFAYNTEMIVGGNGYVFGKEGQKGISGVSTGYPGNPDVSWEQSAKRDLGLEIGLFNQILVFQIDYFYEHRSGIFIEQMSYPSIIGKNVRPYVNLGEMKNEGIDASFGYKHRIDKVLLKLRGNFTYARNQRLKDDTPSPIMPYQSTIGRPDSQQFGLIALGLFQSQEEIDNSPEQQFGKVRLGDIKFKDVNGDGVINTYDRVAIGRTYLPEINYGVGLNADWNGFTFGIFFQGIGNVTGFLDGSPVNGFEASNIPRMGLYEDVAANRWTEENPDPNAKYPRLAMPISQNNKQLSTRSQKSLAFLRMSDLQLGYYLPKKVSKKIGLSESYVLLTGRNLVTFSDFYLWDPALYNSQGDSYPNNKVVNLTLGLTF